MFTDKRQYLFARTECEFMNIPSHGHNSRRRSTVDLYNKVAIHFLSVYLPFFFVKQLTVFRKVVIYI